MGFLTVIEITFGLFFSFVAFYAWDLGIYGVIPFLLLFLSGYLYTGLWSLMQGVKQIPVPDSLARLFTFARPLFGRGTGRAA